PDMNPTRLRLALPYFVGLIVAALLFYSVNRVEYTPRGDALGPGFWPKLAIGLIALCCVVKMVRAFAGSGLAKGVIDLLDREETQAPPSHFVLLGCGVALLAVYAILVPILGFLLGSLLFMAAFMYLGGYRNHVAIWSIAVAATLDRKSTRLNSIHWLISYPVFRLY